ncbi:alkaline phosphatase D family protein [Streptomyces bacillaris]|uniref:alkaline phosphatase D family protein n=1 Tax=Streptomyces bacillaris TaxID=68179 RepID=UPI00364798FF
MRPATTGLAVAATRRRFLTVTGAAAALALAGSLVETPNARGTPTAYRDPRPLFTLGVASGDPLPDGVVIWTRLAPDPLAPFGGMDQRRVPVEWEVAETADFGRATRRGTAQARPEHAHTVHVDVRGLRPWRHYFYRFRAGGQISPVGRTRTAPAPKTAVSSLSLAFASCQAWFEGFYTAHADLARHDHDVVFFLGDYVYEFGADTGVRPGSGEQHALRHATTLDDYRERYALYKLDPDLQAAHAAAPWVVTLDDHEIVDNWADETDPNDPAADLLVRRANGFRAYWEHLPLRLDRLPEGPNLRLYRRLRYGTLAEFHLLDTRQYRSTQATGAGTKPPSPESADPGRTLTGAAQERWLLDGLANSKTRWNVLGQQTAMAQLDTAAGAEVAVPMDSWDGYPASRERILGGAHRRGVRNLVSLGGDLHRSVASDLKLNFSDPDSPTVGTEFVGTSVSSGMDGVDHDPRGLTLLAENPHIRYHNSQRGYVRCTVTEREWTTDYRVADRVTTPGGTVTTRARLVVQDGRPDIQPA